RVSDYLWSVYELERAVEPIVNPMAYAFEPIRALRPLEVEEVIENPLVWGEERVGNNLWCKCGWCTPMPTVSICCQEADLGHVLRGHSCITMVRTFNILCREVDVLEVAMLSLKMSERKHWSVLLTAGNLFRLTAYRQFTLWARGHLGKKNRIPSPACAVSSIRAVFPSVEYHGFEYAYLYDL
uniref:P2X purinoreceptor 7 intracellular domain-containing protein n=1 Tax=Sinocyclocheilus anshuiensis TaxID=1608454 RepID=A0A671MDI7_9TELE